MRITIEVPDAVTSSSSTGSLPSVTTEPGNAVAGTNSEAISGGAGPNSIGAVVSDPVHDAASAGAAEQSHGELVVFGAAEGSNDGGAAPA